MNVISWFSKDHRYHKLKSIFQGLILPDSETLRAKSDNLMKLQPGINIDKSLFSEVFICSNWYPTWLSDSFYSRARFCRISVVFRLFTIYPTLHVHKHKNTHSLAFVSIISLFGSIFGYEKVCELTHTNDTWIYYSVEHSWSS